MRSTWQSTRLQLLQVVVAAGRKAFPLQQLQLLLAAPKASVPII
eukprot:gene4577-29861_t